MASNLRGTTKENLAPTLHPVKHGISFKFDANSMLVENIDSTAKKDERDVEMHRIVR